MAITYWKRPVPIWFWNNFSCLISPLIMKLRTKSFPSLPLPTTWKINIQINVYFFLNISFIMSHSFFPESENISTKFPLFSVSTVSLKHIIFINKADLHPCNSPYLATFFNSPKRGIITFVKEKKENSVFKICQRYVLTCKATCLRALWPRGPVRELTVHRTFHHTGHIHLPCLFQTKLKKNVKWSAQNSRPVSSVQSKK